MTTLARDFLNDFLARGAVYSLPAVAVEGRHVRSPRSRRSHVATEALDGAASPSERRKARKRAEATGRRLQLLARDYFLSQGMRVEIAQKKMLTFPNKSKPGTFIHISKKHDYFGLWDLVVVGPGGEGARFFVQVTTLNNVAAKRTAILESGFPATGYDLVLGHEGGRRFRVLRGPEFVTGEERIEVPK